MSTHRNISSVLRIVEIFSTYGTRVFPEVDHSANIARIVLVEYPIGSVVKLKFC